MKKRNAPWWLTAYHEGQLLKDAGLQAADLYQYQFEGILCRILIPRHWVVEQSRVLVSIINELLHFGWISKEKITLDCSYRLSFSSQAPFIFQGVDS